MLDVNGYEIPDNTVVEKPSRLRLPSSRAAQIQGYIRAEMSRMAQEQGHESFEEANDLDVEESQDFGLTSYERSAEFGLEELAYMQEFDSAKSVPPAGSSPVGGAAEGGANNASPEVK